MLPLLLALAAGVRRVCVEGGGGMGGVGGWVDGYGGDLAAGVRRGWMGGVGGWVGGCLSCTRQEGVVGWRGRSGWVE